MTSSPGRRPAFISVDWGTTALRAYLVAEDGAILNQNASSKGLLGVEDRRFANALAEVTASWVQSYGGLPAILSGMIGSRQGWIEAPYLRCPAGLDEIARRLVAVEAPALGPTAVVPGLDTLDTAGMPDVLRGEECQVYGAAALLGMKRGMFVLPGTHSKWVRLIDGRIQSFRTFMTGEVFAALKGHTILGRMMDEGAGPEVRQHSFLRGLDAAASAVEPGIWLHRLFSVRALGLMDRLPGTEAADYLSGLLVGWEMAGARTDAAGPLVLVGSHALTQRYHIAAAHFGLSAIEAPADSVSAGHRLIAKAAGILR